MRKTPWVRLTSYTVGVTSLLLGLWVAALDNRAEAEEGSPIKPPLQERVDAHRPLRGNPDAATPAPAEPQTFGGFADAPKFTVVPRVEHLKNYPCENCHAAMPANPQPRRLYSPHPALLDHGDGRMWCLDCHNADNRNTLGSFAGDKVEFNDAYLICGQCHYQPQKDWYYGAHGKRVANWQGDRQIYNCTHCHDPHAPAVRPRAPEVPPPIRQGLNPMSLYRHLLPQQEEQSRDQAH